MNQQGAVGNRLPSLGSAGLKSAFGIRTARRRLAVLLTATVALLGAGQAVAAPRTASVSGNWSDNATWGGNSAPVAGDAVTINSAITVTVDTDAGCTSIIFVNPGTIGNNGITIDGTNSLAVSGAITTVLPSVANRKTTIAVGGGSLSAGSIALTGTFRTDRPTDLTISTGSVTVSGNITSGGIASKIVFTGAGTLNAGGTFLSGMAGTLTPSTGTINFKKEGAQTVGAYTYNHLILSGSGTKTMAGDVEIRGDFSVVGPSFASGAHTIEFSGSAPQTLAAVAYNNLIFSGSGAKTMNAGTSVAGNLSVAPTGGSATIDVADGLSLIVGGLTLGGWGRINGAWGSTGAAGATYQNDRFFSQTTGYLIVTTDTAHVWNGIGDWSADASAGSGSGVPADGADVVIASGRVTLTNSTATLGSLILTNGADLYVYAAATNGVAGDPGHGIRIAMLGDMIVASNCWVYPCSDRTNGGSAFFQMRNLDVANGGGFNADYLGFMRAYREGTTTYPSYGPGKGTSVNGGGSGAGYGGRGGSSFYTGSRGAVYGHALQPIHPGSGGGTKNNNPSSGGMGGGLVRIEASGDVTLNGTLTANGEDGLNYGGGGSGGGIFVKCLRFFGATTGRLHANGGDRQQTADGGGGGGRIAVWYGPWNSAEITTNRLVDHGASRPAGFAGSERAVCGLSYTNNAEDGTVRYVEVLSISTRGSLISIR